ncbi:MAG: hypothetical protein ACRC2M_13970 [Planktothrix sp.]
MTIEGVQSGCTLTLYYKILGVTVNTETRIVPDCKKKEPISKPNPQDDDDINNNNKPLPPPPSGPTYDPVPIPLAPGTLYAIMYSGSGVFDYYKAMTGEIYWFIPSAIPLGATEDIGDRINPIFNRLGPGEKIAFYEVLGTDWTFAPWTNYKDYHGYVEQIVPQGQNNAGVRYLITSAATDWLENVGGSNFEPNFFTPNYLTKAWYIWNESNGEFGGFDVKIDDFPIGPSGRTKWFPGTPNAKIVEVPPLKPRPKTNTPTRTPVMDENCCELIEDIYDALAVGEILTPFKISGKSIKELEETIDTVFQDPDLEIEIGSYLELNTFLALLNNRKVAKAVGTDQLEFEDDKKNPIFHYLRWLKDYSDGKTVLEYSVWLTHKEGLKVSKTQFKSLIDIINSELNNSKQTAAVLRADDLIKKGMKVPNELLVPEGTGSTVVYDYPNLLKTIIQILDLNTVSPFTAVLKDSDPAKEGDQLFTKFYPDATSVCKEIVELLLENKIDAATRLNVGIRQSILSTQQMVATLENLSITYALINGIGLPYDQKGSSFVAPFDISPETPKEKADKKRSGGGKGFNPKGSKEDAAVESAMNSLNENRESSTEKLLPDFLKTVKQEYLHTSFSDEGESMLFYLMSLYMRR